MPISIDWATKIVTVPKDYLTFTGPGEVYEMDLDEFRLDLGSLQAAEDGIVFLDTHSHVAPIAIGSVVLARVVEMINDYTVTFESGSYAVNINGGNSNIADVSNVTQASIRPNNSVGLADTGVLDLMSELFASTKYLVESKTRGHSNFGDVFYWDPLNGLDTNSGRAPDKARKTFVSIHDDLIIDGHNDAVYIVRTGSGTLTITERVVITKSFMSLRGPGRSVLFAPTGDSGPTIHVDGAEGVELDSIRVIPGTGPTATNAINIDNCEACRIAEIWTDYTGQPSVVAGMALCIVGGTSHEVKGLSARGYQTGAYFEDVKLLEATDARVFDNDNGLVIRSTGGANCEFNTLQGNAGAANTLDIDIGVNVISTMIMYQNVAENASALVDDGTDTVVARFATEQRTVDRLVTADNTGPTFNTTFFPDGFGANLVRDVDIIRGQFDRYVIDGGPGKTDLVKDSAGMLLTGRVRIFATAAAASAATLGAANDADGEIARSDLNATAATAGQLDNMTMIGT